MARICAYTRIRDTPNPRATWLQVGPSPARVKDRRGPVRRLPYPFHFDPLILLQDAHAHAHDPRDEQELTNKAARSTLVMSKSSLIRLQETPSFSKVKRK